MSMIETLKEHPIMIGVAALAVFLLISRGGSGSTGGGNGATIAATLQSQATASNAAIGISAINADVVKSNNAAYAQMYMGGISAITDLVKTAKTMDAATYANMLQSRDTQAAIGAQKAVALSGIDAGKTVSLKNTQTQMDMLTAQIAGNSSMADKLINADNYRFGVSAQLQNKQMDQSFATTNQILAFQQSSLPTLLQHEENLTRMSGDYNLAARQIDNNAHLTLAQLSAGTTLSLADLSNDQIMTGLRMQRDRDVDANMIKKSESINNGVLSWFKVFGFSDVRLKENIVFTGDHSPRGFRVYSFNFIGDNTRMIGVMAQEVAEADPSAVREVCGFLQVDYSKV